MSTIQDNSFEPVLEIKDLRTHFKLDTGTIRAVDGVSLTLKRGKTLGVIGESGCGKSVTAHSILRLIPSPPGRIVDGEILLYRDNEIIDIAQLKPYSDTLRSIRGNDIGMIFQEPMTSFGPLHTIGNQIMEAIETHQEGVIEAEARVQAIELLRQVGIPNPEQRIDAYPHEFSGGMRQRAMIAMALSCSPKLLIADEPTTSLDVTIEAQILELLSDLQEKTGMAIMLISHNLAVVSEMADEIAVMYLGKRVEFGTNDTIFDNPLHPYTQGLWQSIPKVDGPIEKLEAIPGVVPSPRDLPPGCVFGSRCSKFMSGICDAPKDVPSIEVEPGHFVSCYLYSNEHSAQASADVKIVQSDEHVVAASNGAQDPKQSDKDATSKEAKPIVEVRDLRQFFPIQKGFLRRTVGYVRAVNEVSLTINEGETLGLVGESGCGKSTLGRSILRLYEPTSGEVILHDGDRRLSVLELEHHEMRPVRANMQMIFQDPFASLNERMTVLQNVIEPLVCNEIGTPAEREDKAEKLLMQVGLRPEHLRRYPHSFSGGQRQRIGIARALSIEPKFIVADEPVFALDVSVQAQILNLMQELQDEFGLSYLFISHDMAVIRYMADRIAVMYVGKLVEYAPRDELLQNPAHPYTEALHSAVPRLTEHSRRDRIVLEGSPPDPGNLPPGCVFQTRCRYAESRCREEEPELLEIASDHFVACHLAEELELVGIGQ
ncbi:ABC transporter ATP-binding protein [Chloroflexi bacterium TSY]|nr:ABC transporter ATP-binding protein [Chloroflexi bacterium TSY]